MPCASSTLETDLTLVPLSHALSFHVRAFNHLYPSGGALGVDTGREKRASEVDVVYFYPSNDRIRGKILGLLLGYRVCCAVVTGRHNERVPTSVEARFEIHS